MGKKILLLLLSTLSALYLTNCTSKGGSEDGDAAVEESSDEASGEETANAASDTAEDQAVATDETTKADEFAAGDVPPVEAAPASEAPPEFPAANATADASTVTAAPPPEAVPMPAEPPTMAPPPMEEKPVAPKVAAAPYQKVKDAPFDEGGKLMNTVYLARKGDSWSKVATKIFNDKKEARQLKKWNPSLAGRELRVGDKVYYNSPQRPDDGAKLVTFYEDKGEVPQIYTSQEGDELKSVAKSLLGNKDSWKELWATNTFEPKGKLPAGVEIRYWKPAEEPLAEAPSPTPATEAFAAPPAMAAAEPPAPEPVQAPPPPVETPSQAELPPPPMAQADVPPPPPPAPPPPPPVEAAPVPTENHELAQTENTSGESDDMVPMIAGGIGLVLVVLLVVIIKKRRASEAMDDDSFDEKTHVG